MISVLSGAILLRPVFLRDLRLASGAYLFSSKSPAATSAPARDRETRSLGILVRRLVCHRPTLHPFGISMRMESDASTSFLFITFCQTALSLAGQIPIDENLCGVRMGRAIDQRQHAAAAAADCAAFFEFFRRQCLRPAILAAPLCRSRGTNDTRGNLPVASQLVPWRRSRNSVISVSV